MAALFDFLKKKEEAEKSAANLKGAKKTEKKPRQGLVEAPAKKPAEKTKSAAPKSSGAVKGFSYDCIREPHISEKATNLSAVNQYVFKAEKGANKTEIKKAVEGIYGVDVLSVNVVKIHPKKRRLGKTQGFKKGFLKAVVRIKEGQKIEIL